MTTNTLPDISSLRQLRERVAALTGPDARVNMALATAFLSASEIKQGNDWTYRPPPYTSSIDTALALCERVLPGWRWAMERLLDEYYCQIHDLRSIEDQHIVAAHGKTAPLAILLALLDALSQSQEQEPSEVQVRKMRDEEWRL